MSSGVITNDSVILISLSLEISSLIGIDIVIFFIQTCFQRPHFHSTAHISTKIIWVFTLIKLLNALKQRI